MFGGIENANKARGEIWKCAANESKVAEAEQFFKEAIYLWFISFKLLEKLKQSMLIYKNAPMAWRK